MKTNSFGLGFIVHLRASAQQKQNDRFLALFVRFRVLLPIQTGKISLFEGPDFFAKKKVIKRNAKTFCQFNRKFN